MSLTPAAFNIRPQRRATFQLTLALKDGDGAPISLSGKTVVSQVWDKSRSTKLADFAVEITDEANGELVLTLAHGDTADLPDECRYDVMVIEDATDVRSYYLEGIVRPSMGYSDLEV